MLLLLVDIMLWTPESAPTLPAEDMDAVVFVRVDVADASDAVSLPLPLLGGGGGLSSVRCNAISRSRNTSVSLGSIKLKRLENETKD